MLSIKVLGPGCPNCERLALHAAQAVERWATEHPELEVTIEEVTEPDEFLDYGLLATPGLVINDRLVASGRIPAPSQILSWLELAVGEQPGSATGAAAEGGRAGSATGAEQTGGG